MERDLTKGRITSTMIRFAIPMIIGDLLQQLYNVVDTLIVGQFVGRDALAAVGYDIPYVHTAGTMYGKRNGFFHVLRRKKHQKT